MPGPWFDCWDDRCRPMCHPADLAIVPGHILNVTRYVIVCEACGTTRPILSGFHTTYSTAEHRLLSHQFKIPEHIQRTAKWNTQ